VTSWAKFGIRAGLVEDGVQVVRIVDGARDLSKLKWPTESE
jgi:hypothetical protein